MWDLLEVKIQNLGTHKNTAFHPKEGELILLLGRLIGKQSINSNGAGKSKILDAITIGVSGAIPNGLTKDSVVTLGEKNAVLELWFRESNTKEQFIIKRQVGKNSWLKLFENGEEVRNFDKMKGSAQQYIYEKLGLIEEAFLDYFVLNQGNDSSFVSATDTQQKAIISQFSNYNKIEPLIEQLGKEIQENNAEQSKLEMKHGQLHNDIITLQQLIDDLKDDSDITKQKNQLQERIMAKEEALQMREEKLTQVRQRIASLNKEISNCETPGLPIDQLQDNLDQKKQLKKQREFELDELKTMRSQLAIRSGKVIKCPNCKFEFLPGESITADELEESKQLLAAAIEEGEKLLEEYNEYIIVVREYIKATQEKNDLKEKLATSNERLKELQKDIESFQNDIKELQAEITKLKKKPADGRLQQQQAKLETKRLDLVQVDREIQAAIEQREQLEFQLFVFNKQFRTYMVNKTIRTIQDMVNFYLQKFGVDMRVLINGYTLLKSGEVREKIQVWVIQEGKKQMLFKALSGGEQGRIALCSIIALHKLINQNSPTGGLNLLCLDEFIAALDSSGQSEVIKILEQSKITSVLVAHHTEELQARNKVFVIKENGVSRLG